MGLPVVRLLLLIYYCCCLDFAVSFSVTSVSATGATSNEDADRPTLPSTPPTRSSKLQYITCASTNELASAVSRFVRRDDSVAELGSQLRDVSSTICDSLQPEQGGQAILVDVVRKFPKNTKNVEAIDRTRAMRQPGQELDFYPDTAIFTEISKLDDWRSAFMDASATTSFDVFVLDVNAIVGNDLEWTSLSIIRDFTSMFPSCRLVLVKSFRLNQWAKQLVHGQRWMTNQQQGRQNKRSTTKIIATVGVHEYRELIPFTVRPGDSVLEVGCHLGTSTILLHEATTVGNDTGYCIGVDVGPKIILGAKQRYPDVHFSTGDAWKTAGLLRIQQDYNASHEQQSKRLGFDVVYVDVGGLSGSDGLMEALSLVSALLSALEPRCIVIKSLCMRRLSSTLVPFWQAK